MRWRIYMPPSPRHTSITNVSRYLYPCFLLTIHRPKGAPNNRSQIFGRNLFLWQDQTARKVIALGSDAWEIWNLLLGSAFIYSHACYPGFMCECWYYTCMQRLLSCCLRLSVRPSVGLSATVPSPVRTHPTSYDLLPLDFGKLNSVQNTNLSILTEYLVCHLPPCSR